MMLPLILAASFFTYPLGDGTYVTVEQDMPAQSPISNFTRVGDAMNVGNPVQTSTAYNYDDLDQRYPIRSVVPVSQRVTAPIEERMYMQQYDLENKQKQTQLAGQQLNQRIAAQTFDYDQRVIQQADDAITKLGDFDPYSPDFETHFAEFQSKNPLAFQNPAFRQLSDRLVATHQQIRETDSTIRNRVGANGTASLDAYDTARLSGKDPSTAVAVAADVGVQQERLNKQQALLSRFRDDIAKQGDPTILRGFDDLVAKAGDNVDPYAIYAQAANVFNQKDKPLTRTDYTSLLGANTRLLKDKEYVDLTPEDKAVYDFNQGQMNRYIESQGGVAAPKPATPNPAIAQIGEGQVVTQNGVRFRKTNGQFVPIQ